MNWTVIVATVKSLFCDVLALVQKIYSFILFWEKQDDISAGFGKERCRVKIGWASR